MSGDVIDIAPRIRLRDQAQCKHRHVAVDDDAAELECTDCGKPLDPWWYIRSLAHNAKEWRAYNAELEAQRDALTAKHEEWVRKANETIARLNGEIRHLTDTKNHLQNTHIATPAGYLRVGTVARKRRVVTK